MVTYIVQPGDTLTLIAQRFGSTVASIVSTNNISDLISFLWTGASDTGSRRTSCTSGLLRLHLLLLLDTNAYHYSA